MRTRKIEKILTWRPPEGVFETYNLQRAYCACLTPADACEILLLAATGGANTRGANLRESALRKVTDDIRLSCQPCHLQLVDKLIGLLASVDGAFRPSVGYCLSTLAKHFEGPARQNIEAAFLKSNYISLRRRGYKSMTGNPEASRDLVRRAWKRFQDVECAWLITKTFPVDFLIRNHASLTAKFTEGWQTSKLYLRIAEIRPRMALHLRTSDPISYCYIRAKLRLPVTLREAKAIADEVRGDDRFGLLVWSLGRMGLWRALEYIEDHLIDIERARSPALSGIREIG